VLLIGPQPLNYTHGFGITMSNLYADWPKNRLAVLYSQNISPCLNFCDNQFLLSSKKNSFKIRINILKKYLPFTSTIATQYSVSKPENFSKQNSNRHTPSPNSLYLNNLNTLQMNTSTLAFLAKYKPDILHCAATSLPEINFITQLNKKINAKLIIHVMDDWITEPWETKNLVKLFWASIIKYKYKLLLRKAVLRFGACAAISLEYEMRFKMQFLPYQNCPESSIWVSHSRSNWTAASPFKFVFTGALYSSCNINSVIEFSNAINALNNTSSSSYLFEIHTNTNINSHLLTIINTLKGCSIHPITPVQNKIASIYGTSDALFLPFDFNIEAIKASAFSFPTKLPAYMLSKSPIFAYGPAQIASIKYISDNNAGHVISSHSSIQILAQEIQNFKTNQSLRKRIAISAFNAVQSLTAESVRPKFKQTLTQTQNNSN